MVFNVVGWFGYSVCPLLFVSDGRLHSQRRIYSKFTNPIQAGDVMATSAHVRTDDDLVFAFTEFTQRQFPHFLRSIPKLKYNPPNYCIYPLIVVVLSPGNWFRKVDTKSASRFVFTNTIVLRTFGLSAKN